MTTEPVSTESAATMLFHEEFVIEAIQSATDYFSGEVRTPEQDQWHVHDIRDTLKEFFVAAGVLT